jgi:NTP pyrophosphatase (non-canonical NTP hydrolase)
MEDLIEKIKQWGHDRGIIKNSTPLAQSRKTIEEVHELVTACAKLGTFVELGDGGIDYRFYSYESDLTDAIGDVFVTLVMVAGCAGLDIQACIAQAYVEIKDRKGYLRPDGVFVKEST